MKKLITIITSLIITGSIFITNSGIVYGQNKDMVVDTSQLEEFQESINHQFHIIKSFLQQNEQGQYYVDEQWLEKYIADSSELSLTKNELNELVTLMNSSLSSRRRVRRNVCDLWGLSKEILWEFIEHVLEVMKVSPRRISFIRKGYETGSWVEDNKKFVRMVIKLLKDLLEFNLDSRELYEFVYELEEVFKDFLFDWNLDRIFNSLKSNIPILKTANLMKIAFKFTVKCGSRIMVDISEFLEEKTRQMHNYGYNSNYSNTNYDSEDDYQPSYSPQRQVGDWIRIAQHATMWANSGGTRIPQYYLGTSQKIIQIRNVLLDIGGNKDQYLLEEPYSWLWETDAEDDN